MGSMSRACGMRMGMECGKIMHELVRFLNVRHSKGMLMLSFTLRRIMSTAEEDCVDIGDVRECYMSKRQRKEMIARCFDLNYCIHMVVGVRFYKWC
jgi:hypothetical protein